MKTTIEEKSDMVVLVNVFTVEPEKQQQLIDMLTAASEKVIKHQPGFISANIHASLDGKSIVNYAQWESVEAYKNIQNNKEAIAHMQEAGKFAIKFEPNLYRVKSITHI